MARLSVELATTSNNAVWQKCRLYYLDHHRRRNPKSKRTPRYDGFKNHRRGETYKTKWHCKKCRSGTGYCFGFEPHLWRDNSQRRWLQSTRYVHWYIPNPEWVEDDYGRCYQFPFDDHFWRN